MNHPEFTNEPVCSECVRQANIHAAVDNLSCALLEQAHEEAIELARRREIARKELQEDQDQFLANISGKGHVLRGFDLKTY